MLLGIEFLDELHAGVPAAGSPAIQESFATSYATTAAVLLFVPAIVGLLLEPLFFLAADRWPRRWFLRAGLAGMALSAATAALAPGPITLAIAVSIAYVSTGIATGIAQGTLVELHPGGRERALTRWMLTGLLGDLSGPLLLAGLAAIGLGWRGGYAVVAAMLAVWTLAAMRPIPDPPAAGVDDDDPGVIAGLRAALRNRRLLLWLAAASLCDLLDELLVVFASLHLRDALGAGPTEQAIVLAAFVGGGAVGVTAADRLLARWPPMRVLAASSLACVIAYAGWLAMPTWWLSAIAMLAVGATAAPLYPIVAAQGYAALPGKPGTVQAAAHLYTPFNLAMPWLLGWLADTSGVRAALVVLIAQPVGIGLIALHAARRPPDGPDRAS